MRLKITFKTEKLPILYRHRFMALIKEALSIADKSYKNGLYPEQPIEKTKPFVFSVALPSFNYKDCPTETFALTVSDNFHNKPPNITDKVIPIKPNQHISLIISSSDFEFMANLYNGLLAMKKQNKDFPFNDEIKLTFERAFVLNEKKILSNEVVFKTLSPVLIEEQTIDNTEKKKDKAVLPPMECNISDEKFNALFNSIHKGILKDIMGQTWVNERLKVPLQFSTVKLRKSVVKHTIRQYWQKNPDNPVMKFTCFEGSFKLTGHPEVLQMLYQIGIGLRTGQGFGMVEIL